MIRVIMYKSLSKIVKLIYFLVVTIILANTATAQNQDATIKEIMRSMRGPSAVDFSLREIGFSPNDLASPFFTKKEFIKWPDVRKLEAVYAFAEAGKAGDGKKLLNELMIQTAKRNVAIIRAPEFIKIHPDITELNYNEKVTNFKVSSFNFKLPSEKKLITRLPIEYEKVIQTLVDHSPKTPGGLHGMVSHCCNITSKQLYKKMRTADSYDSIIRWAVKLSPTPPTVEAKLGLLVERAQAKNISISADISIKNFVKAQSEFLSKISSSEHNFPNVSRNVLQDSPNIKIAAEGISDMARRVATEVSPQVLAELAHIIPNQSDIKGTKSSFTNSRFRTFEAQSYKGGLNFAKISKMSRGFGGVILGNNIHLAPNLPFPTWFEWIWIDIQGNIIDNPSPEGLGCFTIYFADGSTALTAPMLQEHAWAAITIAYLGMPGELKALNVGNGTPISGDAVGLVGYTGSDNDFLIKDYKVITREQSMSTFIVNPSISGFQLGIDALIVDAVPFKMQEQLAIQFEALLENSKKDKQTLKEFKAWLFDDDRSTYKFIDVPIEISRNVHGIIELIRKKKETDKEFWSTALRKKAFLTFQKFNSNSEPVSEEDPPFYHLVPTLINAWPEFKRLNEFAGTLAQVRWLKSKGAEWLGEVPIPNRGIHYSSLIKSSDKKFKLDRSAFEMRVSLLEEVMQKSQLSNFAGNSKKLAELNQNLYDNRLERLQIRQVIDQYALTVLGEELYGKIRQSQERLSIYNQAVSLISTDRKNDRTKAFFQLAFDIDIRNISHSELSSLKSGLTQELKIERIKLRKLNRIPSTQFISNLEDTEANLSKISPLNRDKLKIKRQLIQEIPPQLLREYNVLSSEVSQMEVELQENEKLIKSFKMRHAADRWFLTQNMLSSKEKNEYRQFTTKIQQHKDELSSSDNNFASSMIKKWQIEQLEYNIKTIFSQIPDSRFSSKIDELQDKQIKMELVLTNKKNDTNKKHLKAIKETPLDGFEKWYNLNFSYRETVLSPLPKMFND